MLSNSYGKKLDPLRRVREPFGVKGTRQSIVVTNNPFSIDAYQNLLVRFPNISVCDVIVSGTMKLAFTISITSQDPNATLVQNICRAISRTNLHYQGIDTSDDHNDTKLRVGADDGDAAVVQDKAIADTS